MGILYLQMAVLQHQIYLFPIKIAIIYIMNIDIYIIICMFLIMYFIIMRKYSIALIITVFAISVRPPIENFSTTGVDSTILQNTLDMIKSRNITVNNIKVIDNGIITNFNFKNGAFECFRNSDAQNIANIGGVKFGYQNQDITIDNPVKINGIIVDNFQQQFTWPN